MSADTTTVASPAAAVLGAQKLPHPVFELLRRYAAVFKAAWAARTELAGPQRLAHERAFLPAALSLQETPVHPAPRRAMWALMALVTAAIVWSCIGQLDIVAVAPGRVIVSDRTKLVQPLEAGVVKAIHVRDGDKVQAGQLLVELDPTAASADTRTVAEQLATARTQAEVAQRLLTTLDRGAPATPAAPAGPNLSTGSTPTQAANLDASRLAWQVRAEWADIAARLSRLDAEAARREAELVTVREGLNKLETMLPLARQREADVVALADQGFMSGHAGQDRRRERIELERDLATQQARLREAQAASAETRETRNAALAEIRRTLSDRLTQAQRSLAELQPQGTKAEQRQQLTRLVAPVTGTVQQLAVHTPGGVVTPAQVLLVVVPDAAEVVAEVTVDNKDIGFVQEGQKATIKLETFPFTRFGTVPATVQKVSADAVIDETRGAVFTAVLKLDRAHIDVNGRATSIAPGMNLTAEVKTGQRRVIDYVLSPVQRHSEEGMRER